MCSQATKKVHALFFHWPRFCISPLPPFMPSCSGRNVVFFLNLPASPPPPRNVASAPLPPPPVPLHHFRTKIYIKTIKRLEDFVKTLVDPPLPPRGPWKFLHPNEGLGATALPALAKRAQDEKRYGIHTHLVLQNIIPHRLEKKSGIPGREGRGGRGRGAYNTRFCWLLQ